MYISKINLNGFKSFANPTSLELQDSMFISIVGPNGSGKSNILDAVKWIMGESSTKQLRSSSSSDVLFAGTKNVNAKNVCEVEIIFDNSLKKHSLPHNEISIKRKYFRSGDNQYFINNNKVRQKDIVSFFLELGISKSSLLMVNQGKIDSFINMSGIERAKLIEQVAQVAIFEERKKESIAKLNRSNDNISRLNDILKEKLQTQKILEKSAQKALEYRKIKTQLDEHIYLQAKTKLHKNQREINSLQIHLQELVKNKYEINELITTNNEKYTTLKETERELNITYQNLNTQVIASNKQKQELIFKLKEKSLVAQNNLNQVKYKYEELTKAQKLCVDNLQTAKNNLTSQKINLNQANNNKIKIEKILYQLNSNNVNLQKNWDQLNNSLQKAKFELKNLEADLNYRDLHKIQTKVPFATLKDCFTFDKRYEAIIYDVLGNNLKNLVTNDTNDAKVLLNYINERKLTKISIYPLNNLKAKFANKNLNQVVNEPGFLKLATQVLTSVETKYDVLINYLLTNVIIVDNLENANKINNKFKNMFTIVTLDLQYIYPSGIFSGGYNKFSLANKIIQISKLKDNIKNWQQQKQILNENINTNQEKIKKLNESAQKNFELIVKYTTQCENTKDLVISLQTQQKKLNQEIINYSDTIKKLSNEVSDNLEQEQIATLEQTIILANQNIETTKQKINEIENEVENLRLEKDNYLNKISRINTQIPQVEFTMENLIEKINDDEQLLSTFKPNYKVSIDNFDAKMIVEAKNKLKRIGSVDFEVIEQYEIICEEIQTYENNILDVETSINKIQQAIKSLEVQSSTRFNKFFEQINENFQQYFKYIFPNGYAKMKLNVEDNIRNIEVIASTKGSSHNLISLLSGGEKALTIIALLFSILKVSNFSFVILDEIEAALDESNVDKIAKILTDFAKNTQIITITHRRGTMNHSDVLYGISHGIVGISQAIKIKLGEEDEFSKKIV